MGTCLCGHGKNDHSYMGCHVVDCDCVYYSPQPPVSSSCLTFATELSHAPQSLDPDAHLGAVER